jgi:hypothetical protein
MGMFIHASGYRSGCGRTHNDRGYQPPDPPTVKDPDLSKYEVITRQEKGAFVLLRVRYAGIPAHHGLKLMLYKKADLEEAEKLGHLDPHFLDDYPSPIARFTPTPEGDVLAVIVMNHLAEGA